MLIEITLANTPVPETEAHERQVIEAWLLSKGAKIINGKIVI